MKFKNALLSLCLFLIGTTAIQLNAQKLEFPKLDVSSLDAATYPRRAAFNNYLDEDEKLNPQIRVLYSRPKKKDRVIFGELVPYGQEWRLGANECTEVRFYQAVEIGGTVINPGYYTMFADVHPNNWVIKFSKERFIAGTRNRKKEMDVLAVSVPVEHTAESRESFTIGFQKMDDNSCNMIFEWDRTKVSLPINFNPALLAGDDVSPMDLAVYPANSRFRNFVKEEEFEASAPKIRVVYSRPQAKGRKVFGELKKFGDNWRVGANETTEVTFYENVKVGGKDIRRGTYGLMATINQGSWDITLHKNLPSWGIANHDESTNVATFKVSTEKTPETVEALSIIFDKKDDKNVHMIIAWDDTMVRVPVEFK